MPKQLLYAVFSADKDLLYVGTAPSPLDYFTLYRLQRKFQGVPDLIILEEFEGDWKHKKELQKLLLKLIFSPSHDPTQPDSVNRARHAEMRERFFKERRLISGAELLQEYEGRRREREEKRRALALTPFIRR